MSKRSFLNRLPRSHVIKKNQNKHPSWLVPSITAIAGIIGIFIGFFLTQLFLPQNILFEKRTELKKDIILYQLPYLLKAQRFALLGDCIELVLVQVDSLNKSQKKNKISRLKIKKSEIISVPKIFLYPSAFNEWKKLSNEIYQAKDILDPEINNIFDQIMSESKKYDTPTDNDITEISEMLSKKTYTYHYFCSLNHQLLLKIEKLFNIE